MHAHPARFADRLIAPSGGQALFIKGVPCLMHDAHETRDEAGLVIARGGAKILSHPAAEGMRRFIKPAVFEIEPGQGHQLEPERLLPFRTEWTLRPQRFRTA